MNTHLVFLCTNSSPSHSSSTPASQVLVYNFADLRLLHAIETLSNPGGLLALSPSADSAVLACPGLHAGQVGGCCWQRRAVWSRILGQALPCHNKWDGSRRCARVLTQR